MASDAHGPVISVMLAVPDAAAAARWYARGLGATELWDLGGVVGLTVEGAPFFLGEPANNGWDTPTSAGTGTVRVEAGRPIAEVAKALGNQRPVDLHLASPGPHRPGLLPGLSSPEQQEPAAGRRIAQLETELTSTCRAAELRNNQAPPFDGRGHPGEAQDKLPVPGAGGCRGRGVRLFRLAQPGAPGPGDRPPLADRVIGQVPTASRQTYGSRWVHAERTWAAGSVSACTLWSCCWAAPACRASRPPKDRRGLRPEATATGLVQRQSAPTGCDQRWSPTAPNPYR